MHLQLQHKSVFACLTPALQGQQKARAVGCSHCPLPTTGKAPSASERFFRRSEGEEGSWLAQPR